MKVIIFVGAYLPGYKAGGPIQSVANLVDACGDKIEFYIVTFDRDLGDNNPYPNIIYDGWMQVGKAKIRYLSPRQKNFRNIKNLMLDTDYDLIYINGIWEAKLAMMPILINRFCGKNKPIIHAVRGNLGVAAMENKKTKKKLCLWIFYKLLGNRNYVTFQCSSEQEEAEVKERMGKKVKTMIVWNVPGSDTVSHAVDTKIKTVVRLVFISRIASKKNLDGALKSLMHVQGEVEFGVYGIKQYFKYWNQCQAIIDSLPKNIKVSYNGVVKHRNIISELSKYDCFFFPTHHENFGHVIHEALRSGLPVLISDKTPWHDVVKQGCGWVYSDYDYKGFAGKIDELVSMEPKSFYKLKVNALNYAKRFAKENDVIRKNLNMFEQTIGVSE